LSRLKQLQQGAVNSQIWKSVFRVGIPNTNRKRVLAVLGSLILHLHPVKVRRSGVRMSYTWCMGGTSFFLFLVETVTGLLLMFYYRPTIEYAFTDIMDLREQAPFGIMREMHRWGAHAMVIAVWLHMFRVFMTGSYKPPREFNWNVGVILLVLTLLLSFTGYLLPWDQLAIWAITVGSNMARASPGAGTEGPMSGLIKLGDIRLIHAGDDARFACWERELSVRRRCFASTFSIAWPSLWAPASSWPFTSGGCGKTVGSRGRCERVDCSNVTDEAECTPLL